MKEFRQRLYGHEHVAFAWVPVRTAWEWVWLEYVSVYPYPGSTRKEYYTPISADSARRERRKIIADTFFSTSSYMAAEHGITPHDAGIRRADFGIT